MPVFCVFEYAAIVTLVSQDSVITQIVFFFVEATLLSLK